MNTGTTKHGAIEVKLAWKQLGPGDVRDRFLRKWAEVINPDTGKYDRREMGLVGMHIAMRTQSSPEWIWATFEQVDNVKVDENSVGRHSSALPSRPSFYNPAEGRVANTLPPRNAVIDPKTALPTTNYDHAAVQPTTWSKAATTTPVQVTRVIGLDQPTIDLNNEVQALLRDAGSVLKYQLIGTQWPVHPNAPAFPAGAKSAPESIIHKTPGDVVPVLLVNTIMETYFQKGVQPAGPLEQDDRLAPDAPPIDDTPVFATESCVGCHYSAGICVGFKKNPTTGDYLLDKSGKRVPIYGINSNFGKTGNANFSWLLQIEARSIHDPR